MKPAPITTRSVRIFYIAIAVLFAIFAWRLFDLQVINHDRYREMALNEHFRKFEIPASRGTISVRDGAGVAPLVLNEVRPTLFADPTGINDAGATSRKLQEMVGGNAEELEGLLKAENTAYVVLAKKLTAEQAEKVREVSLPGIGLQDVSYRVYPEGKLASQIVGFVNNELVGQYGIEAALNDELLGKNGQLKAITDVNGIPLTVSEDTVDEPAQDGQDIVLTIDRNIQAAVESALEAGVKRSQGKSGSAIVYDPDTGAVLAMANYPTFSPENFSDVEDFNVFNNRVVSEAHETGSGVKVFTVAAGLNEGVIQKDSTFYDASYVQVDDRRIENAGEGGAQTRSMLEVIQKSVNTGVVHVLSQLGGGTINRAARDILYDYFTNKFGFGSATGIAQTSEASGYLLGPDTVEGNNVRYANMAFGQGMTVTMLQMVAAFSSVINGGTYYKPYLVDFQNGEQNQPQALRSGLVTNATTQAMLEMTQAVVDDGGGLSARRPGYLVGGKTGTAQLLEEDGTYSDDLEVGSFIGYVGSSHPEYVIMTRVNEPGIPGYAGSVAAAPLFADISNWLIDHQDIVPRQ